jgi:hypothetical protein
MADRVNASMDRVKIAARNPLVDLVSACSPQELPSSHDTVLPIGQLRYPRIEMPRVWSKGIFFSTTEEKTPFDPNRGMAVSRHAADGGGRPRARGASKVTFAQQKRLQPAVAASGFDPFK